MTSIKNDINDYLSTYGPATFSPNNPYARAVLESDNRKNKSALFEAALRWEEEYANTQRANKREDELLDRQRAQELEDRAHEEEYSSPYQQAARMRAAGINPDLQNVSGGESLDPQNDLGTVAPQQGAELDMPEPPSDLDIFNSIFGAVGSVASLASSAYGIFAGSKLLPGQFQAQQLANAGQQTANQIAEVDKFSREIDLISDIAGYVVDVKGNSATTDDIRKFGYSIGYTPTSGMDGKIEHGSGQPAEDIYDYFVKSPELRSRAAQRRRNRDIDEAVEKQWTLPNVEQFAKYSMKVPLAQIENEYYQTEVQRRYNKILSAFHKDGQNNYPELLADAAIAKAGLDKDLSATLNEADYGIQAAQLQLKELEDMNNTYDTFVKNRAEVVKAMDGQIKELEDELSTIKGKDLRRNHLIRIAALRASRSEIQLMTYNGASSMQSYFMKAALTMASNWRVATAINGVNNWSEETSLPAKITKAMFLPEQNISTFGQAAGNKVVGILGDAFSAYVGGKAGAVKKINSTSTITSTSNSKADVTVRRGQPEPPQQ